MASQGQGCRGRLPGNSQPPPVFYPQAFIETMGTAVAIIVQTSAVAATIVRTSATVGQGGTSNLQRYQAHHPLTYMGGGDSMIRTTLAIEREMDDTWSIWEMGATTKRKKSRSSSSSINKQKISASHGSQRQPRPRSIIKGWEAL